jgi:hypothetical protein
LEQEADAVTCIANLFRKRDNAIRLFLMDCGKPMGSGLNGLARGFIRRFVGGEFAEFAIDQRQQFLGGRRVTIIYGSEAALAA